MKTMFAVALVMSAFVCGGCATHHGDHKHKMKKDDCCGEKEADCCQEAPVGTTLPSK